MSNSEPIPSGLVVIARDATGQIVTRITSHRDLVGAMYTARCVLKLKVGAVRGEVHWQEAPTSDYAGQPLAAMNVDDLPMEQLKYMSHPLGVGWGGVWCTFEKPEITHIFVLEKMLIRAEDVHFACYTLINIG